MWEFWGETVIPGNAQTPANIHLVAILRTKSAALVAIKLGTFQVLLYNSNLFSLQQPFPCKDSISERGTERAH